MKKYISLLVVVLCFCQLNANNSTHAVENSSPSRIEKKKYKGIQELKIEHSYGNITIKESKTSEVNLEIHFYDNRNKKAKAEVDVRRNTLSVKTNNSKKNITQGAKIDYVISIPARTKFEIDLNYGNLKIDNITGDFSLRMEYGNVNIGSLGNAIIKGKYNEINIGTLNRLSVFSDYSRVRINQVSELEMKSKHTEYDIKSAGEILKGSYSEHGDVKFNLVTSLDMNLKYSNININRLNKKIKVNCDYSDVKIDKVTKELKSIDIKASFSDIKITWEQTLTAEVDLKTSNGDVDIAKKYDQKYSYIKKDTNKETRKGTIGKGNATASIVASTTYADIIIK